MSNLSEEHIGLLMLHGEALGSRQLKRLREKFGSYALASRVSIERLRALHLTSKQLTAISESKKLINRQIAAVENLNIKILLHSEAGYPTLLRRMEDAPAVLYVRGELHDRMAVSIVGSRRATGYGRMVTDKLVQQSVEIGLTVVSGLAYGVDALAHQATLKYGGYTVAVMGSGLQEIYPAEHSALADRILASGGALITEFPLYMPSYPGNFPQRNRIIAGLSTVTVVVEGSLKSGSLITAAEANSMGRVVMPVPGPITSPASEGPNFLIHDGAEPYINFADLAAHYGMRIAENRPAQVKITDEERRIIEQFDYAGTHIDKVAEALQLDIADLSSKVIVLELKGVVRQEGAGVYRRII